MNLNNLDTQDQALVTMYVELADLVAKMRVEQRSYFKTKSTTNLDNSKKLERKVDKLLEKILITKNQTVLFA
jgi:hypothetical protein